MSRQGRGGHRWTSVRVIILIALFMQSVVVLAQGSLEECAKAQRARIHSPLSTEDGAREYTLWLDCERAAFIAGSGRMRLEALRKLVELAPDVSQKNTWTGYLWREEWRSNNLTTSLRIGEAHAANATLPAWGRSTTYAQLVGDYFAIGQPDKALVALRNAEEMLARDGGTSDAVTRSFALAMITLARGTAARHQGDSWAADRHFREAQGHAEDQLSAARKLAGSTTLHLLDRAIRTKDSALSALVTQSIADGRFGEAEMHAKLGLAFADSEGKSGAIADAWLARIGEIRMAERDFRTAAELLGQALVRQRANGLAPGADRVITATLARIQALIGAELWDEALKQYEGAIEAIKGDPVARRRVESAALGALLQAMNGRHGEARRLIDGSVAFREANYGRNHVNTIEGLAVRSIVEFQGNSLADSLRDAERVQAYLATPDIVPGELVPKGLRGVYVPMALRNLLRITAMEANSWRGIGNDLFDRSLQVADYLRARDVQEAIADSAIRTFTNDPAIGPLIRQEQDLRNTARLQTSELLSVLDKEREAIKELARGEQDEKVRDRRRALKDELSARVRDQRGALADTESRRSAAQRELRSRFPAYASLVSPQPPVTAEIVRALRKGEALVSIFINEDGAYVWAVNRDGKRKFHFEPKAKAAVEGAVSRLRRVLDLGELDRAAPRAFDMEAALSLYALLVRPVEGIFQDSQTVIVTAGGDLARIPLAILVRGTGTKGGESSKPHWWIRTHAIATVPAASAFVALRSGPMRAAARPFFGVGDPQFTPSAVTVTSSVVRRLMPVVTPARAFAGTIELLPLPETREEILALAKALGADPENDTLLGAAATRANVLAAELSDRRVVAFATHGLRAGEVPGLGQPALALAASGTDSPFLTLDDVLKLKLSADLVVLSACNTAASDGKSGEALSGLARGFLYAGARAMLLTHWAVETESAQKLMVATFASGEAEPGSLAQRLRTAQLAMIDGKWGASYSHPAFWAPYALVGDPGR